MARSTCDCGGGLGTYRIALPEKHCLQEPTSIATAVALGARSGVAVAPARYVHLAVPISGKAH